jgi:hypothetical protein
VTVVERGNSGAYNLKPQASQSGTDQPIDRVDGDERPVDEGDDEAQTENETDA